MKMYFHLKIVEIQYISRVKKYKLLYFQMRLSRFPIFETREQVQAVLFDRLRWDWSHIIRKDRGENLPVLLFSIFAYFPHTSGKYDRKKRFFRFWKIQNFGNLKNQC